MVELNHSDPQMARLDPRVSRLRYRMERLMLTPLFRVALRFGLPFALCFGGGSLWFSVDENREAFNLMVADVRATVENRPEFQVKMMAVDGASDKVAGMVRAELPVDFPISSFELDLAEMQKRVAALDPVESAELRIRQGGVLQVDVVERVPAVLWRVGDRVRLLDDSGVLVGPARARANHVELPVIAGDILTPQEQAALWTAPGDRNPAQQARAETAGRRMAAAVGEVLRLHAASAPIRARLRGFERMGGRRWDVVLDRGQRIMLPEREAVRALDRVIALALTPQMDLLSRDLVAVDLRLPRRPTLRMTEHSAEDMWRIKAIEAGGEQE